MSAEHNAGARLYALIGEAVHELPPRVVTKLDGILKRQEASRQACNPAIDVPSRPSEPEKAGDPCHGGDAWRSELMRVDRKLRGLGTVLEIVHAAHTDVYEGVEEQLIGEHLVDGLLAVGRDLVESARDTLRGVL